MCGIIFCSWKACEGRLADVCKWSAGRYGNSMLIIYPVKGYNTVTIYRFQSSHFQKSTNIEKFIRYNAYQRKTLSTTFKWLLFYNHLLAPIPTYILGPNTIGESANYANQETKGGEICPNVTVLGMLYSMIHTHNLIC